MKRKAAREEEDFKNRINPGGIYTAHRDSDGKQYRIANTCCKLGHLGLLQAMAVTVVSI